MASKLLKYEIVSGITEKGGIEYPWTGFKFIFEAVDGREEAIMAFPRNVHQKLRLLGVEEWEIQKEKEIRHKK